MITRVYQGVTLIASIILLPIFMLVPRGRKRILERYGFWNLEAKDVVWFHSASVGEINGILPVIRKCRERYPNARILVTATSVTGLE